MAPEFRKYNTWYIDPAVHLSDGDRRVSCVFRLVGTRMNVELPWQCRPDGYTVEWLKYGLLLEGSEAEHDSFLTRTLQVLESGKLNLSRLFFISTAHLEVGPFYRGERYRSWHEVTGTPPDSRVLETGCLRVTEAKTFVFLSALAKGIGKVAAGDLLAKFFGLSKSRGYQQAGLIIESHIDFFALERQRYALSNAGLAELEKLKPYYTKTTDGGGR